MLSLTILVITGIWGTLTKNHRMISSFMSNWVCILILMIIQGVIFFAALSNCDNQQVAMYVDCDNADEALYNIVAIG